MRVHVHGEVRCTEPARTIAGLARVAAAGQASRLGAQAGAGGAALRRDSPCLREPQLVAPGAFD